MNLREDKKIRQALQLYFICGTTNTEQPLEQVVTEAAEGGATMFQFREKGAGALTGQDKKNKAQALLKICRRYSIPFIINDDVELALEIDADGIHVGQDDDSASQVRERIGGNKILGVSARTIQEAEKAIQDGADYVGTGPMAATASKDDAGDVVGPERIAEMRRHGIKIPITAIGGITSENTPAIIKAGADGVSVISALAAQTSPAKAAEKLASAVRRNL